MYKILIVDDEEIEREGMAQFIDWASFGVELIGTAQNEVEALEMIAMERPDIVLTDIKMPVMDGLELIRRAKESFPQVHFIVLSGYGEYEFTSQAMERGIRHYLLKPCDEEQIEVVLDAVKAEIEAQREQNERVNSYHKVVEQLLPKAKKQIFRDMLLDPDYIRNGREESVWKEWKDVVLLSFSTEKGFDYLEQFVMSNILIELLGEEHVYLSTTANGTLYYLIGAGVVRIKEAAERMMREFKRMTPDAVFCAMSRKDDVKNLQSLYEEVRELLRIGKAEERTGVISYELFLEKTENSRNLIDYEKLRSAEDFADILSEIYLAFLKMRLNGYTFEQKKDVVDWCIKILCGESCGAENTEEPEKEWRLMENVVNVLASSFGKDLSEGKEEQRVKDILFAMFRKMQDQELSIRYLAKEELFMNEDYLGRLFLKNRKQKFSSFLLEERIRLAQGLMRYAPWLRVSQVAEMVGYSPDGQYFSKAFKKAAGCSPTEYKEELLKKSDFYK